MQTRCRLAADYGQLTQLNYSNGSVAQVACGSGLAGIRDAPRPSSSETFAPAFNNPAAHVFSAHVFPVFGPGTFFNPESHLRPRSHVWLPTRFGRFFGTNLEVPQKNVLWRNGFPT